MKKVIITGILIFFLIPNINSDTLDDILNEIKSNNFELKKIESDFDAASAEIKSGNNLQATDFDVEYHFGERNVGDKYGFGVSQAFDWPGLYYSRGKAAKASISALQYASLNKQMDLLLSARNICLKIINLNKQIALEERIETDMFRMKELYDKGFKYGEISILDINKLKIELLNIKQAKNSLERQRIVLVEELKALNGDRSVDDKTISSLTEYPESRILPMPAYLEKMEEVDPEYKYYSYQAEAGKYNISASKRQWFPTFKIGYKYFNELGVRFNGISAGISIPIFSNRHKTASAKAAEIANRYSGQTMVAAKHAKVQSTYSQIQSLQEQIDAYRDVLNDGNNNRVLKKALDGGQITLLQYLTELKYFIEAETNLLNLEYEYHLLLSDLNKYELLSK